MNGLAIKIKKLGYRHTLTAKMLTSMEKASFSLSDLLHRLKPGTKTSSATFSATCH